MTTIQTRSRRSGEISFVVWVRTISVFLILLCHLTQTHSNAYVVMSSQLFNVGVNIFIIISGYLFGRLGVKRPYGQWLFKRLKRIFIPYWIFLVILLTLQTIRGQSINPVSLIYSFLGLQRFTYVFPGSQHTWFITAILLCYLLTPLIDTITAKLSEKSGKKRLILFVCLLGLAPIGIAFLPDSAILATVPFYALAFVLGKCWDETTIRAKHAIIALAVAALSFIIRFGARFLIDGTILYTNIVALYSHYIAAFGFFIAAAWLFSRKPWKFVKFISNISFEVYLYHYMFMWPPLSVMSLTGSWYINALIALVLAILAAWIMHSLVGLVSSLVTNCRNNKQTVK